MGHGGPDQPLYGQTDGKVTAMDRHTSPAARRLLPMHDTTGRSVCAELISAFPTKTLGVA